MGGNYILIWEYVKNIFLLFRDLIWLIGCARSYLHNLTKPFTIRTMKNLPWILLSALLLTVPPAFAQAPAAAPGPVIPAPAKKAWLIRLIPPRPTFDKDMTDAEGALMEQHFVYWKGMFEKGSACSEALFSTPKVSTASSSSRPQAKTRHAILPQPIPASRQA
jgi:hypothetical protein